MDFADKFCEDSDDLINVRGFHVDPEEDRGYFWICYKGKKIIEFESMAEVERTLCQFLDYLVEKYGPKNARVVVQWDIDYSSTEIHKGAEKSLEDCAPSYREKKKAMIQAREKKKQRRVEKKTV